MSDDRTLNRDIDLPTFFDNMGNSRCRTYRQIKELLNGTCDDHDNLDQILDEFAFHARFEAIYLYENEPHVPMVEDQLRDIADQLRALAKRIG